MRNYVILAIRAITVFIVCMIVYWTLRYYNSPIKIKTDEEIPSDNKKNDGPFDEKYYIYIEILVVFIISIMFSITIAMFLTSPSELQMRGSSNTIRGNATRSTLASIFWQ
jgi:NADH:ubiquinone oxidoreductase subunit 3 (subunit A)